MAHHTKRPRNLVLITLLLITIVYFVIIRDSSSISTQSTNTTTDINIDKKSDKLSEDESNYVDNLSNLVNQDNELDSKKPINKSKVKEDKEATSKSTSKDFDSKLVQGNFMPKLANDTLKAELGRSTWKLFHTILSRYDESPTDLQREYLQTFIDTLVHVYPCGDCAYHFSGLLKKYPPQLTNRQTAAVWGCHIHNKVNERLSKPEYDCSHILEDYDCGCGDPEDEEEEETTNIKKVKSVVDKTKGKIKDDEDILETEDHLKSIKVESSEESVHG